MENDRLQKELSSLQANASRDVQQSTDRWSTAQAERLLSLEKCLEEERLQREDAEKRYTSEVSGMQQAMNAVTAERDETRHELADLKAKLDALIAQDVEKDERITNLQGELSRLQSAAEKPLTVDTSNGTDSSSLKAQLVSLALSLERAETRRAEVIDRLVSERQANADSLRRMSSSMKRYYSAVSFRDL